MERESIVISLKCLLLNDLLNSKVIDEDLYAMALKMISEEEKDSCMDMPSQAIA